MRLLLVIMPSIPPGCCHPTSCPPELCFGLGEEKARKSKLRRISASPPFPSWVQISGSVKYNGRESREFVIRRTAGLVEQQDDHMPTLTVLETVQFAAQCQNARVGVRGYLDELDKAAVALRQQKSRRLQLQWSPTAAAAAEGQQRDQRQRQGGNDGTALELAERGEASAQCLAEVGCAVLHMSLLVISLVEPGGDEMSV